MVEKNNIVTEALMQLIKAAVADIPLLGVTIDLYDKYQSCIQYNNIVDVLTKHEEQIKKLNDTILDMKYVSSNKRINDIVVVCQKAKDELNEEKREAYAKYLTAGCLKVNNPNSNKDIYLDYIGRMDVMDIYILNILSDDLYDWNSIDSCSRSFEEHFPSSSSNEDFDIHLDHLKSLGLIKYWDESETDFFPVYRNQSLNDMKESLLKQHLYIKSSLGKALMSYLNFEDATENVE